MDNEHARSKDAYARIQTAAEIRVPTGLTELPDGAAPLMELDGQSLVCTKAPTKQKMKALRDIVPGPDSEWQKTLDKVEKKYKESCFAKLRTLGTKTPAMLQTCGLLQTAVFLQEPDGTNDCLDLYWIMSKWLLDRTRVPWPSVATHPDLVQRINQLEEADMECYRFIYREAMAYMTWVKRAVSLMLPETVQGG